MAEEAAIAVQDLSEVAAPMDMEGHAQENERFTAISLNSLDKWADKHPRLLPKLKEIKAASLIFPFKASPYLVDELIDWETEADISEDPFYRLVYPTMSMLEPHHREKLNAAVDEQDPLHIKDVVAEIRDDLNSKPQPAREAQRIRPLQLVETRGRSSRIRRTSAWSWWVSLSATESGTDDSSIGVSAGLWLVARGSAPPASLSA
jgi:hypothetical protein